MTGQAYHWGPLDRAPLDLLETHAAQLVGLDLDTMRAGMALLDRAPAGLLELWKDEHVSTRAAYAGLIAWEAGNLPPLYAQALGLTEGGTL